MMFWLSTLSKMSFKEEAEKYFCRMSCRSGQSRSICLSSKQTQNIAGTTECDINGFITNQSYIRNKIPPYEQKLCQQRYRAFTVTASACCTLLMVTLQMTQKSSHQQLCWNTVSHTSQVVQTGGTALRWYADWRNYHKKCALIHRIVTRRM